MMVSVSSKSSQTSKELDEQHSLNNDIPSLFDMLSFTTPSPFTASREIEDVYSAALFGLSNALECYLRVLQSLAVQFNIR
jgi:hypothetical protein